VHPRVVERVRSHLRLERPLGRALDVGCGAGLSTRALGRLARHCTGVDPVAAMVRLGPEVAPEARFCVGRAEQLPARSGSIDLIGAAGSLNYADLDRFFPEAARVLAPRGVLVVYDFSPGRRIPGSDALTLWFERLMERYPAPADSNSRELDPERLGAETTELRLTGSDRFEIGLTLEPDAYLEYVMTETNVADAVRLGTPAAEIRAWCRETLEPVFRGSAREILFEGYVAYMEA
jgi:SAM-dependent methyltransferase